MNHIFYFEMKNHKQEITVILRRFLSPRGCSGVVRGPFEGHFRSFGSRSGAVPGSFGGCFGIDGGRSGPFQGHSGVVRDSFGGRSAVVRGSFENFSNFFSKNFRKNFRKNLEIYFVRNLLRTPFTRTFLAVRSGHGELTFREFQNCCLGIFNVIVSEF